MRTTFRAMLIAGMVLLLCASVLQVTEAADIYVDGDEGSDATGDGSSGNPYATVTTAVENATAGDSVIIRDGTYEESMIEIGSEITIRSETGDPDDVTVGEAGTYSIFRLYSDNITIDGITIQYGTYKVYMDTVDHCTISNNRLSDGYTGILIAGNYENAAMNNTITGNNITGNTNIGLQVGTEAGYTTVSNNHFSENGHGVQLYFTGYETVRDNVFTDNDGAGLYVHQTDRSIIENNTFEGNVWRGIYMCYSTNNTLRDNTMSGSAYNLEMLAVDIPDFIHDVDTSNTVDGRPIYYWVGEDGGEVPSDAGAIILVQCYGVTVDDHTLYRNGDGVLVVDSTNCVIENISAYENMYGIRLRHSNNITISDCDINQSDTAGINVVLSENIDIHDNDISDQAYNQAYGLWVRECDNVTAERNIANENWQHGIYFLQSYSSYVANNTAHDSHYGSGIYLNDECHYSLVENNNGSGNAGYGIYIYRSFWVEVRNNSACDNVGGFAIRYTGHDTVRDNLAWGNGNGFDLDQADYITIEDNVAIHNSVNGVKMTNSEVNTIQNNDLSNNRRGVEMMSTCQYNTVDRNDLSNSIEEGIKLSNNNNMNNITDNIIDECGGDGIRIENYCLQNTVFHNTVTDCGGYGIRITPYGYYSGPSTNNTIYDNYLDNEMNAYDNFTNYWNTGKVAITNIIGGTYLGGNYYSDYLGVDEDEDGLGDTGHEIEGGDNVDDLPLYQYREPEAPTANFTWEPSALSNGTVVNFVDLSDPGSANIVNWTWDLPATSHPIAPMFVYSSDPEWRFDEGVFEITLNVTNGHGLSNEVTKTITVGGLTMPEADFYWTPRTVMNGTLVSFTDNSTAGSGDIVNWTWDLPSTSHAIAPAFRWVQNPTWTFDPGSYDIILTITDSLGYNDSVTKTLDVTESVTISGPYTEWNESGIVIVNAGGDDHITITTTFLDEPPGDVLIPNGTYFDVISGGPGNVIWVNITFMVPTAGYWGNLSMYVWNDATQEWGNAGDDRIIGGSGDDTISCNVSHLTVFAVGDADVLTDPGDKVDYDDDDPFPMWVVAVVIVVVVGTLLLMQGGRDRGRSEGTSSDEGFQRGPSQVDQTSDGGGSDVLTGSSGNDMISGGVDDSESVPEPDDPDLDDGSDDKDDGMDPEYGASGPPPTYDSSGYRGNTDEHE